jgi:hypothetical protein
MSQTNGILVKVATKVSATGENNVFHDHRFSTAHASCAHSF